MKKCNNECEPLCDFCIYYTDFNQGQQDGLAGEGICSFKNETVDIIGECDNFHCFRCELGKEDEAGE